MYYDENESGKKVGVLNTHARAWLLHLAMLTVLLKLDIHVVLLQ